MQGSWAKMCATCIALHCHILDAEARGRSLVFERFPHNPDFDENIRYCWWCCSSSLSVYCLTQSGSWSRRRPDEEGKKFYTKIWNHTTVNIHVKVDQDLSMDIQYVNKQYSSYFPGHSLEVGSERILKAHVPQILNLTIYQSWQRLWYPNPIWKFWWKQRILGEFS